MQKKLIAVAVAGALAAPAVALAQTSTVNIYGNITYEYGIVDQGRGQRHTDFADRPGGSAIGFRGEEKLGRGLSAWFQCESSADVRALEQTGWCSRNSAVGFRGAFGNLHFGRWDTPMKRALNVGTVGAEETGTLGASFLPFGGSGGADATETNDAGETALRRRWKRRESALSYYESPRFGGFQFLGAFSTGNAAADNTPADGTPNAKPRVISIAGIYSAGPLGIGVAYERHNQFGAYAPTSTSDTDDKAWGISAAYTFAGKVKLGGTFLDARYETAPGMTLKRKTWTAGVEWAIAGPHSLEAQYGKAGDSRGNSTLGVQATANGGIAATGPDTGGDQWTIAYVYSFSKRTTVKLGYIRMDNDANTRAFRIGTSAPLVSGGSPTANGQNVDGYAFLIKHRF